MTSDVTFDSINEIVTVDIETSGSYPLYAEICEVGVIRSLIGQDQTTNLIAKTTAENQTLIRTAKPLSDFITSIHGITNDMLVEAPQISSQIREIYDWIQAPALIAHHAPFDVAFLAWEFEKAGLVLPTGNIFCTSLISRKLISESTNHKLRTLVQHLGLTVRQAHRALDDAKTCLDLFLSMLDQFKPSLTVAALNQLQGRALLWNQFSILDLRNTFIGKVCVDAILNQNEISILYRKGVTGGKRRAIRPIGIVRNPEGDYLVAWPPGQKYPQRYFLSRIAEAQKTSPVL